MIGTAKGAIKRGDWVNEDNVVMGSAPPLDQLEPFLAQMKAGYIQYHVDQQPYLQGYVPVMKAPLGPER